jgi:hypothetical protein
MPELPRPLLLALALLGVLSPASRVSAEDTACAALFEQAAAQLAAEQYPRMLRIADDRMRLCPDPESALLVGLAQANMVDSLAVSDPAEREQARQSALRNLRVAAAGGTLKPMLQFTAHEWIVHLQALGGGAPELDAVEAHEWGGEDASVAPDPLEVPPAPPPQPQPVFPWGPVLTGIVGVAALTTGIVLGVSASDSRDEARSAANQLRLIADDLDPKALSDAVRRTRELNESADSEARWSTVFLVGGAIAMVTSVVWYVALPPKGKWRWAAAPTGLQAAVHF